MHHNFLNVDAQPTAANAISIFFAPAPQSTTGLHLEVTWELCLYVAVMWVIRVMGVMVWMSVYLPGREGTSGLPSLSKMCTLLSSKCPWDVRRNVRRLLSHDLRISCVHLFCSCFISPVYRSVHSFLHWAVYTTLLCLCLVYSVLPQGVSQILHSCTEWQYCYVCSFPLRLLWC